MSTTSTVIVSPTPTPVATPVPVAAQTVVPAAPVTPTLYGQLQGVDPLVWAALAGVLVVPFVHQLIKRFVKFLNDSSHRTTNYAIAGALSLLVGVLSDLQNSGVLTRLHNPVLAAGLSAALSFALGQQVYGFFVKTNEEAKANTVVEPAVDPGLPVVLNP